MASRLCPEKPTVTCSRVVVTEDLELEKSQCRRETLRQTLRRLTFHKVGKCVSCSERGSIVCTSWCEQAGACEDCTCFHLTRDVCLGDSGHGVMTDGPPSVPFTLPVLRPPDCVHVHVCISTYLPSHSALFRGHSCRDTPGALHLCPGPRASAQRWEDRSCKPGRMEPL